MTRRNPLHPSTVWKSKPCRDKEHGYREELDGSYVRTFATYGLETGLFSKDKYQGEKASRRKEQYTRRHHTKS
jgi:hypothetical protein